MSSFFPSFRRVQPTEDAPFHALPHHESTAVAFLDSRLQPLLVQGMGLHETDPWRTLSKEQRHHMLLRFLRFQLLNVEKAEAQIRQVAEWRRDEKPWNRDIADARGDSTGMVVTSPLVRGRANEILVYLAAGLYIKANTHRAKLEMNVPAFFEYCTYMSDGLQANSAVMLFDMSEVLVKNVDLPATRYAIRIFLDFYPEAFCKILFINYPKWVYGTWKCIAPLLDARSVGKIVWVESGESLRAELCKVFRHEELPTWLGGMQKSKEVELLNGQKLDVELLRSRLVDRKLSKG